MLETITYKNYKTLCEALGWMVTTGCSKQSQLKVLDKICHYHKQGNKFIIDKVYVDSIKEVEEIKEDLIIICKWLDNHNFSYEEFKNKYAIPLNVKSGVYMIRDNDEIYIGSSNNLLDRFKEHYWGYATDKNNKDWYTKELIQKKGSTFELLLDTSNIIDRDLLYSLEMEYIKLFRDNSNLKLLNKKFPRETRVKKEKMYEKPVYKTVRVKINENDIDRLIGLMKENWIDCTLK